MRFPAGVDPRLGGPRRLAGGVLVCEFPSGLEMSSLGPKDSLSIDRARRGPALGGGTKLLADCGREGGAEGESPPRPSGDGPGPGELVCARDGVLEGGGGGAAAGSGLGACGYGLNLSQVKVFWDSRWG